MTCGSCGYVGEEKDFTKSNVSKDGKRALCKKCKSISDKKYRETHKESVAKQKSIAWRTNAMAREVNRIAKERQRFGLDATEYVKDKVCSVCGMTNEQHLERYHERLHIHHPNNDGRKNMRLGITPVNENLVVMCRSCHVKEDNHKNKIYKRKAVD